MFSRFKKPSSINKQLTDYENIRVRVFICPHCNRFWSLKKVESSDKYTKRICELCGFTYTRTYYGLYINDGFIPECIDVDKLRRLKIKKLIKKSR